jgi:hypothetical protein
LYRNRNSEIDTAHILVTASYSSNCVSQDSIA